MKDTVAAAVAVMVLIGSFVEGCASQAGTTAARPDDAAIRSALAAQLARIGPAFSKKDAKMVSPIFTDDATWVLPDASTFHGKADIEKGATAFFTSYDSVTSANETIEKLIVASDSEAVTFTTGKFMIWMKGKKAGESHMNPFADAWRKGADGTWRITYEVNAEGPAATPPATKKP